MGVVNMEVDKVADMVMDMEVDKMANVVMDGSGHKGFLPGDRAVMRFAMFWALSSDTTYL